MTDTPRSRQLESQQDARVVSRHLPAGYAADPDAEFSAASQPQEHEVESSLKLQGGDIHRDLYKINARAKLHQRSATFAGTPTKSRSLRTASPNGVNERTPLTANDTHMAGGFRREYMTRRFSNVTAPMTNNFVSFLDLYGGFAGEDLFESDSDEEEEHERDEEQREQRPTERRPLLRHKSSMAIKQGDAGMSKSFFTLLKAFVGTGIMFLPRAFHNGGILFSSITLLTIAFISTICFRLLLNCRQQFGGGGYGELGGAIGGPYLRTLILASITVSQLGFVCAGVIFTAENLMSFLNAVTPGNSSPLSTVALISMQLIVLVPLAFIRNISALGSSALLADVFILFGLTYIYYFDISTLATRGIHPTVKLFNPNSYTLTIGSAIFTFEGIGLILPIQSSMKQPEKFPMLLYIVMAIITVIFTSVGLLSYATFGDKTLTVIISNFPQDNKLVNTVQFLYSIAVLVGTPVQLFPAMRIIEGKVFGHLSGKRDSWTKWKKNVFRAVLVVLCILVSILGASNLDKFVALIGSFACVPLVYIYPPFMHLRGVAGNRWEKAGDVMLMVVGVAAMVYTTFITAVNG